MNLRPCASVLQLSASTLRLSAARGSAVRLATAPPAAPSLTSAAACPRCYCSHVKVRSFFHYMKRKVVAPPTPPYSHVCQVGNPVLRSCAAAVDPAEVTGPEVQAVISTMVKVMRKLECVGLSAPQVGVPLRIIMLEYPKGMLEESSVASIRARGLSVQPLRVFINPELRVLDSRTVSFQEGCESIVGFSAVVPRFLSVEVSGLNEKGEAVTWKASGWSARILQHEIDHLNGVLYIDHMDAKTFINVHWPQQTE